MYKRQLEDFIVYHRSMAIDLIRARTHRRALNLSRRMLEEGEAPGVQMNWHCLWEQEKEYVVEAAKKLAEERNKSKTPAGGYDPWATK